MGEAWLDYKWLVQAFTLKAPVLAFELKIVLVRLGFRCPLKVTTDIPLYDESMFFSVPM